MATPTINSVYVKARSSGFTATTLQFSIVSRRYCVIRMRLPSLFNDAIDTPTKSEGRKNLYSRASKFI